MNRILVILGLCLLAATLQNPAPATIDATNIANGWYANLPPVTRVAADRVVACLVENGAPPAPTYVAHGNITIPGDNPIGPAQIQWTLNGRMIETDAALTYYGPDIAYIEIAHTFGLPVRRVNCFDRQTATVTIRRPLGEPRNPCPGGEAGPCFLSIGDAEDRFEVGATFTDHAGTYRKRRTGWAFFGFSYWVLER